jgi:hypothetical protein
MLNIKAVRVGYFISLFRCNSSDDLQKLKILPNTYRTRVIEQNFSSEETDHSSPSLGEKEEEFKDSDENTPNEEEQAECLIGQEKTNWRRRKTDFPNILIQKTAT